MNPNVFCGYCLSGRLILCSDEVVTCHPFDVFRREITIKGSFAEMTSFTAAIAALRAGRARTEGIITHRFSLDDYGRALDTLAHDRATHKDIIRSRRGEGEGNQLRHPPTPSRSYWPPVPTRSGPGT